MVMDAIVHARSSQLGNAIRPQHTQNQNVISSVETENLKQAIQKSVMMEMRSQEMDALTVKWIQTSFALVLLMLSRYVLSNVEMVTCKLVQDLMKYAMMAIQQMEMGVHQHVWLRQPMNVQHLLEFSRHAN